MPRVLLDLQAQHNHQKAASVPSLEHLSSAMRLLPRQKGSLQKSVVKSFKSLLSSTENLKAVANPPPEPHSWSLEQMPEDIIYEIANNISDASMRDVLSLGLTVRHMRTYGYRQD